MSKKGKIIKGNIRSGLVRTIVSVLLPFLLRTVIIYVLGDKYLGLNSLFTSVLSVINLAELGFSNAIIYCMYGPIARGEDDRVCALLAYYKRVYQLIGTLVVTVGICITPLIPYLINGGWPDDINIYILYIVYLLNASISYFFYAYKSALLIAAKRIDLVNWPQVFVLFLQYVLQIGALLIFRNYYIFVVIMPLCTIATNIIVARASNRHFPQYQCRGEITGEEKKTISTKLKGMMIYRISETTRNSLDSVVLSSILGLTVVALYNNYYYIFTAVYGLVIAVNQSIQAFIGADLAVETKEYNYREMRKYNFIIMCIITVCSCCMVALYQPFVKIWVGRERQLSDLNMILFAVYFYILNMNDIRNLYFDGKGLWPEGKWTYILESASNLILNIVLAKLFGVTGVIIATILTIFVFSFICRTNILFRTYYEKSAREFYTDHLKHILAAGASVSLTYIVGKLIVSDSVPVLFVRGAIGVAIPAAILCIVYYRSWQFKEMRKALASRLLRKKAQE